MPIFLLISSIPAPNVMAEYVLKQIEDSKVHSNWEIQSIEDFIDFVVVVVHILIASRGMSR